MFVFKVVVYFYLWPIQHHKKNDIMVIKVLRLGIALLLLTAMPACQNEQEQLQSRITALEAQLETEATTEAADSLLSLYDQYLDTYPEDEDTQARYLYRMASLQYRLNQFDQARHSLEQAIREHYDHENTSNSVQLLHDLYSEKIKHVFAASVLKQMIAQKFPDLAISEASADLPPITARLDTVARGMYQDTTGRIDLRLANDFVTGSSFFALIAPDDPQAPEYIYRAAETARTVQAFSKALQLYDWLIDHYPAYERTPQALFLKGFTLDNDLQQLEEARAVYEDFLARYPQDDFADDAQFLLDNLGKSDEEIIQSFGESATDQ